MLNIHEKRKEAGYTQEQMARLLNVTLRHYINIEKRKVLPNIVTGLKLAKILKVNPFELWNIE
ncbi:MAG: helix-turn-helix transcriptional regulator [Thermosipho sp. (in: Bacteria)]|nr:helix-turn-helix transcriptional regulator [Thermosipho sp. (in: thermotogales)]